MKPVPKIDGLVIVNKPKLFEKKVKKKDQNLVCLRED